MVGFGAEKVGRCPLGEDTKFCIKDLLCGMCGFGRSLGYLIESDFTGGVNLIPPKPIL